MRAYLIMLDKLTVDMHSRTIVAWLSQYFNYECLFMLDVVQVLLHGCHNTSTMNAYLCLT